MLIDQIGVAGAFGADLGGPRFPSTAPPFYQHLKLPPTPGQLVLFPGWLVHAVTPNTAGPLEHEVDGAQRVSFSFNLHGEWLDTSSLLLERTHSQT